jgi:ribosomal protein S18 acetylase RimI-like enzyme
MMQDRIDIRPLQTGDQAAWAPLWTAYLAFYGVARPQAIHDLTFARYTDPGRDDMRGWLARLGEQAVGLVHAIVHPHGWQSEPVTYLQDLYTAPAVRGRGVGRALIETVYADADARGAPAVYWLTQAGNAAARRLYDRIATKTDFIKYARG